MHFSPRLVSSGYLSSYAAVGICRDSSHKTIPSHAVWIIVFISMHPARLHGNENNNPHGVRRYSSGPYPGWGGGVGCPDPPGGW